MLSFCRKSSLRSILASSLFACCFASGTYVQQAEAADAVAAKAPSRSRTARAAGSQAQGLGPATKEAILAPGVVAVATNSIFIKKASQIEGDLIVNDGGNDVTLVPGFDIEISRDVVITGDVKAEEVHLNRGSSVGIVCADVLDAESQAVFSDSGSYSGGDAPCSDQPPIISNLSCEAHSERPHSGDLFVAPGTTLNLPSGLYGVVTVGGTLVLNGSYEFESVAKASAGGNCPFPCRTVRFAGRSEVVVKERFDIGKNALIEVAPGITAADVEIHVNGTNGGPLPADSPPAVWVGQSSDVAANFCALNGTVKVDKNSAFAGAIIGRDILIDQSSAVEVSAFVDEPPTAEPQTLDNPDLITLRASDPEGEDLTFSIVSGPTVGTLGVITPIVPDPIANPNPPPATVQPPIMSATVAYSGNPSLLEDSFTFRVNDPIGNAGDAVVTINPPPDNSPPPPPLTEVEVSDVLADTAEDTQAIVGLDSGSPASVGTVTYFIDSLPSDGSLSHSGGGTITAAPTDLLDQAVVYKPDPGFNGADSFTYGGRDSTTSSPPCSMPSCDTGTVSVNVSAPQPLTEDQSLTGVDGQSIPITLIGNPGGVGDPIGALSVERVAASAALPSATVGGNVCDSTGDGLGDGADTLPGSTPGLVAAGVNVSGSACSSVPATYRVHMEWDISGAGFFDASNGDTATVTLTTNKGSVDSLDTEFYVHTVDFGQTDQDGLLTASDFETPGTKLAAVVMTVPAGPTGTEGTFGFDATSAFLSANAYRQFLTIQGRVDETITGGGSQRGLQIYSTANGSLLSGKEPKLSITSSGATPIQFLITDLSQIPAGSLLDSSGAPVAEFQSFSAPASLTFATPPGSGGQTFSFGYRVTQGPALAAAVVDILVSGSGPPNVCEEVGRRSNCSVTACNDGLDNDNDFVVTTTCSTSGTAPPCGPDDDPVTEVTRFVDFDGANGQFQPDPQCTSAGDDDEAN